MCLAAPGKIVEIDQRTDRALVDYFGSHRWVGILLLPEARVGDFVMVHAGEAIAVVDEEQARQSIEFWEELSRFGCEP